MLNLGLAWGLFAALQWGVARFDAAGDAAIVQFLPFLAWPFLARRFAHQHGTLLPLFLEYTVAFTCLSVAAALGLFLLLGRRRARRGAIVTGGVGALVTLGLMVLVIGTDPSLSARGLILFGLTGVLVGACLAAQWTVARFGPWGTIRRLAAAPALAIAGTQLFDGIVTYLAVVDPLDLAPGEFHEQVPLSRLVLEATGVGYPLLKWGLAIGIGFALSSTPFRTSPQRIGLYLILLWVGLGPALYSGFQLV